MVEEYMQEKITGLKNQMIGVKAVEAGLETAIHRAVIRRTNPQEGEMPDYSQIPENEDLQNDISRAVDRAYSLNNRLHPCHDGVNNQILRRNFYNQALIQDLLFPHKDLIKRKIKDENFIDILYGARKQSQENLHQELIGKAANATITQFELDPLKQHLTGRYGAIGQELEAVDDKERLIRAIAMDYMKYLGANVGVDQISEAIRNPTGQQQQN